jgi:uncharacterized SAM-binding protein YcdF (DUF218 family)
MLYKVLHIFTFFGLAFLLGFIGFLAYMKVLENKNTESPTDGIVVFTGAKGRIGEGVDIFNRDLGAGLLVSGVNDKVDWETLSSFLQKDYFKEGVTLGYEAMDTQGNAEETIAWMHKNGYKTLRLVTSIYHMPRSLLEMKVAQGQFEIIPHVVNSPHKWWNNPWVLYLSFTEYVKFLITYLRIGIKSL